jgi:hypothetical protein
MASIPAPATLPLLGVGDFINYKGQQYVITALTGPVDNGQGSNIYTVTIVVGGNNVTFTASANDTVVSNPGTEASGTGHEIWTRSGQSA